jgi:oligopeptide/dipeptide ABC transporter ATP-binding protein
MTAPIPSAPLLEVENLAVSFATPGGVVRAVSGVSFAIGRGETLAIVGESGSGKSTTALALMGLIERSGATTVSGTVRLHRKDGAPCDILGLPDRELRKVRGNDVAMIFQEPMSSLNPVYSIGAQIGEAIRLHQRTSRSEALSRALTLLRDLGIPNPEKCLTSYPHQLSGGMRQRVMIAIALSCRPNLLIADEPTTALDVTVQAQILDLLARVQEQTGMAIVFITHNLGVVSIVADRTLVMYAGEVVESLPTDALFGDARMPYTSALLRSLPRLSDERLAGERLAAIPGSVPDARHPPTGCRFHPRCDHHLAGLCDARRPELASCGARHLVRCLRWREIAAGEAA